MTMQAAFAGVVERLDELSRAMECVQWAVVEGRAQPEDHALANRLENIAGDLLGRLRDAHDAAESGLLAWIDQADVASARQSLIECQQHACEVTQTLMCEVLSIDTLDALDELGRDAQRWATWVRGVEDALDRCRQPADGVTRALFQCWQELTDRIGGISISVRTQATGHITQTPVRATTR
jgi:hypothetical protein